MSETDKVNRHSDSPAYLKHVLTEAQSIDSTTDLQRHNMPQPNPHKFANPAPLGLAAFAGTTFLLSLFNLQTRGITTPNLIVGMAMAYGGLVQLLAGMWEFACGNTFGATAFSSYGGFWISFGCVFIPGTGILEAYTAPSKAGMLDNGLALYLFSWFIFTFIMLLASLRSSVGLVILFFFLDCTFLLLAIGLTMPHVAIVTKAGGALGLATAFIAWYVAAASLLSEEGGPIKLPNPSLRSRDD